MTEITILILSNTIIWQYSNDFHLNDNVSSKGKST